MKKRINQYTNRPQYLVPNLIAHLKKLQRKRHNRQELFCIGVTMADIYPNAQWNFVYGSASIDEGIGIYSFARLDPLFPHSSSEILQKSCTKEEQILILKRAISTYLHEIMHLFGLEHCIYYLCLMNGANCENEIDGQLLYLCPICLKKMYLLFGKQHYNIIDMYKRLLELSKKVGFQEEADWYENRLKILNIDSEN
jgi:archaemetzincin